MSSLDNMYDNNIMKVKDSKITPEKNNILKDANDVLTKRDQLESQRYKSMILGSKLNSIAALNIWYLREIKRFGKKITSKQADRLKEILDKQTNLILEGDNKK